MKASELVNPPRNLFGDISQSYDCSVIVYFTILKWLFFMMILFTFLSLPSLIFTLGGQGMEYSIDKDLMESPLASRI